MCFAGRAPFSPSPFAPQYLRSDAQSTSPLFHADSMRITSCQETIQINVVSPVRVPSAGHPVHGGTFLNLGCDMLPSVGVRNCIVKIDVERAFQ